MIKRVIVRTPARGYVDGRYIGEEKEIVSSNDDNKRGHRKNRNGNKARKGKPQPGAGTHLRDPEQKRSAPKPRKNRTGKKTPFRVHTPPRLSISEAAEMRRMGDESKSGQFAEALSTPANVKRERLHKVLAQSGHGSRRDMEIMIASGRVMVNGMVATLGTQVGQGDAVLIDHRPVKLQFAAEMPRVLLYHKPEGEIVTTSDPGNRATVFDNLPKVENGKWVAIGRLDINTSGLLIFTTSGELANKMMHPRFEVEREYAVRILGELTPEQTQALLAGVPVDDESGPLARFDSIEPSGGEGANKWYKVVIKEGRNREVRKMFESQGLSVSRLLRTRFGKISLPPRLLRGKMVEMDANQVKDILHWAGVKIEGLPAEENSRPARHRPEAGNNQQIPNGNKNVQAKLMGRGRHRPPRPGRRPRPSESKEYIPVVRETGLPMVSHDTRGPAPAHDEGLPDGNRAVPESKSEGRRTPYGRRVRGPGSGRRSRVKRGSTPPPTSGGNDLPE